MPAALHLQLYMLNSRLGTTPQFPRRRYKMYEEIQEITTNQGKFLQKPEHRSRRRIAKTTQKSPVLLIISCKKAFLIIRHITIELERLATRFNLEGVVFGKITQEYQRLAPEKSDSALSLRPGFEICSICDHVILSSTNLLSEKKCGSQEK
jgi:hypothetical protein